MVPSRSGTLISPGRETHLVCHGSLNPEVQYVYHCTTHVPYNTAYANARSLSIAEHTDARKPTLTTTANTMGPKIIFTFISIVPTSLDNRLGRVRERGLLASGVGRRWRPRGARARGE